MTVARACVAVSGVEMASRTFRGEPVHRLARQRQPHDLQQRRNVWKSGVWLNLPCWGGHTLRPRPSVRAPGQAPTTVIGWMAHRTNDVVDETAPHLLHRLQSKSLPRQDKEVWQELIAQGLSPAQKCCVEHPAHCARKALGI